VRQSIAAAALIGREHEGQTVWLAQWNARWGRYHLVGGHKREEESFRECIVREIGEELGFREGSDFSIGEGPSTNVEFTAWSEGAREETGYTIEIFWIRLSADAERQVSTDPRNRWLTETEIRAQRTSDDQPVSVTMGRLLEEVNWGREWPRE
jgi:8-oxo-dGTP pyrophosphatase MutT (NUDIX family)